MSDETKQVLEPGQRFKVEMTTRHISTENNLREEHHIMEGTVIRPTTKEDIVFRTGWYVVQYDSDVENTEYHFLNIKQMTLINGGNNTKNETKQTLSDIICEAIEKVTKEMATNAYYKTSMGYQSRTKSILNGLIQAREDIERRTTDH